MSRLKDLIREAAVSELNRLIEDGGQKFLTFTRLTTVWVLCVSDGVDLWRLELDEDELDAHRDLAGISTNEVMLTRIRNGFNTGDLSVAQIGNKVTLTVGKAANAVSFDLYEAKAAEKRAEMQNVLFRLAEKVTSLDSKLSAANQSIEQLKAQKGAGGAATLGNAFMDLGPKKGVYPTKMKPKKTGMSAVNPTSKKRKAAHGVVFD